MYIWSQFFRNGFSGKGQVWNRGSRETSPTRLNVDAEEIEATRLSSLRTPGCTALFGTPSSFRRSVRILEIHEKSER